MSDLKNNILNDEINNNNLNTNSLKNDKKNEIISDKDLWTVIYSYFKDLPEDKKNKLPYKKLLYN